MAPQRKAHLLQLKRFLHFGKGFLTGASKREGRKWLGILLGLCAMVGVVQVFLSYGLRDVVTALSKRDAAGWKASLLKYVLLCCASVPIGVMYRYSQERLSLAW